MIAGSIVSKRIGTHGGIVDPHGGVDVVQCVIALSGVAAGIASVRYRRRNDRPSRRRKPKARKHKRRVVNIVFDFS